MLAGLAAFGWHPFHRLGAAPLSGAAAAVRLLGAAAYVTVCMIGIGAISLALGLALPGPAEALGVSVAFVVIAEILDGQASLHAISAALPVHYWQRWTTLLDAGGGGGLATGLAVQVVTIAVALGAAWLACARRDPAA